jgi:hypothetical protein
MLLVGISRSLLVPVAEALAAAFRCVVASAHPEVAPLCLARQHPDLQLATLVPCLSAQVTRPLGVLVLCCLRPAAHAVELQEHCSCKLAQVTAVLAPTQLWSLVVRSLTVPLADSFCCRRALERLVVA